MSEFLVYRASAGSGKTYTLVLKYLECILRYPDEYRKTLAVTFTNKAADEMKERILRELDLLSQNPNKSAYTSSLIQTLGLSAEILSKRAASTLCQMLHDYSHISVGTIDRFFQQILRAFAREEGISGSYQIELDAEAVLQEIVGRLIRESANDKKIRRLLVGWIFHRMKSGKSWHGIETELVGMGGEILRENILDQIISDESAFLDPDQLNRVRQLCEIIKNNFEKVIEEIAREVEKTLAQSGFTVEDFSYKQSGPVGFLLKRSSDKFNNSARALQCIDSPDKWIPQKAPAVLKERFESGVFDDLNNQMIRLFEFFESDYRDYATANLIIANIHSFSLARYLVSFLLEFGRESDTILMNLTQPIIRNIIRDNPTPFIFEKTGTQYRHYLIDEFQDTSTMQWSNFKPLLINCLSEGGLGMVVGDVKQSIYRWRNSNWRLLQEDAVRDLAGFGSSGAPLLQNQRSREAIIRFNNQMFAKLPNIVSGSYPFDDLGASDPDKISPSLICDAYSDSTQERGVKSGDGGRVEIIFRSKEKGEKKSDYINWLSKELPLMVDDLLLNRGYRQEDILFLVRRNREGQQISKILTNYRTRADGTPVDGWAVVSADVFRIGANPAIQKLILAFHILADPDNSFYQKLLSWELTDRQPDGSDIDPDSLNPLIEVMRSQVDELNRLDLTGLLDRLINLLSFGEPGADQLYLLQFRDMVSRFSRTGQGHIAGFLEWWERRGHKQMLVNEGGPDAMKIMTIHKAKGLSSPVVIIPFCNWELDHSSTKAPYLWVSTDQEPFSSASVLPVVYSSKMKDTWFSEYYQQEWIDVHLDNLNLLYVSFTRPKDVLIAFCSDADKAGTVANALREALVDELDDSGRYVTGDPEQHKTQVIVPSDTKQLVSGKIRLGQGSFSIKPQSAVTQQARLTGEMVHQILEKMITVDDLDRSLIAIAQEKTFAGLDLSTARNQLEEIFKLPPVVRWFDGSGRVIVERSILIPGKGQRRPDRIVIHEDAVDIIDYKTGNPESAHRHQVAEYMELMAQLDFSPVRGFILYIDQKDVLEVITTPTGPVLRSL